MERDDEVKGSGNSIEFAFRTYDPRLGKFLCVDPLAMYYSWLNNYHSARNNPILNIDLEGLEPYSSHNIRGRKKTLINNKITGGGLV